jgi:hypothetical protein
MGRTAAVARLSPIEESVRAVALLQALNPPTNFHFAIDLTQMMLEGVGNAAATSRSP